MRLVPSSALTLASHVSDVKGPVFPPEQGLLESTPHHTWPNKLWVTSLRCLGASLGLKSHQDSNWDFQQQHLIRLTIPSQRRGQLGTVPLPFGASSFSCLHLCLFLSFGFRVCGTTGAYKQAQPEALLLVAVAGTCSVPRIHFLLLPIFNKRHRTALLFNILSALFFPDTEEQIKCLIKNRYKGLNPACTTSNWQRY